MNPKPIYNLLVLFLLFCFSCNKSGKTTCTFPTDYGVVNLAETTLQSPWTAYQDAEEVVFYNSNGDSVNYVVSLETETSLVGLLCNATCPENPELGVWIEYDSEQIEAVLDPFVLNPTIDLNTEKPGLIQLTLNSFITSYEPSNVEVIDAIDISISRTIGSSTEGPYTSRGKVAYDLRGGQDLTSYSFFDELEINGTTYQNVYQTTCEECGNEGVIFYNHSVGLISFMGPSGEMWYK